MVLITSYECTKERRIVNGQPLHQVFLRNYQLSYILPNSLFRHFTSIFQVIVNDDFIKMMFE